MSSGLALLEQRAHVVRVLVDDPGDEIGDALSGRVWNHPELEVLGAIVEADAILVVHKLVRPEPATEDGLHDELVLANAASPLGDVKGPVAVRLMEPAPLGARRGAAPPASPSAR